MKIPKLDFWISGISRILGILEVPENSKLKIPELPELSKNSGIPWKFWNFLGILVDTLRCFFVFFQNVTQQSKTTHAPTLPSNKNILHPCAGDMNHQPCCQQLVICCFLWFDCDFVGVWEQTIIDLLGGRCALNMSMSSFFGLCIINWWLYYGAPRQ